MLILYIMTCFYQFSILCMFVVPFIDLLPDCILDWIVKFISVPIISFVLAIAPVAWFFVTLSRQIGHALGWYITDAIEDAPPFLPSFAFAFPRSITILRHRTSFILRVQPIKVSDDLLHTPQSRTTTNSHSEASSDLQAYPYLVKALMYLSELFEILVLAALDLIGFLTREWKMERRVGIDAICGRIEGSSVRLSIGGPPGRLMTGGLPACLLVEGMPARHLIGGQSPLSLIERPPSLSRVSASSTRLFIKGPSPARLLIEGSQPRKLITGPPVRLLIEGPPIQRLLIAPPARLLIEGPPVQSLIMAPPTRLLMEGSPTRKPLEASLCQRCIEGLLSLRLISLSLNRLLIDGPLLRWLITAPLPLPPAQGSPARRLIAALPHHLVEAPRACVLVTTPLGLLHTSQDPILPRGEAMVLEVEVGVEVPVSGTTELSEQPVSCQPLETLSAIYSKEVDWVAEDVIFVEPCINVEDWELTVIRRLNEAVIVFDSLQDQGSPSLDSDSDSDSSPPSSSTNSPDPSTGLYSSSKETPPKVLTTSSPFLDGVKFHGITTDPDGNPCEGLQVDHHISDDSELVDPLSDFNREGRFLRNITVPDFEPVSHGGFGVVWKGADRQGNAYAVKLITRIPESEEMLQHEIKAMKRARSSQWTVELYHEEASAEDFLLVMDWCAGGDLFDLWKNSGGYMLTEEAIYYTAQMLLGIHDLHTRGIVHRDIKFENIMLHHGHIKIIDLGLAITFDHDTVPQSFEIFHLLKSMKGDDFPLLHADDHNPHIVEGKCGTPGYFPPEVDEVERYSFGVDYYAMGVMLHTMLTSDHPYYYCPRTKRYDFTEVMLDPLDILDSAEMDFLMRVLAPNPRDRLSVRRMKAHPIFSDINWTELEQGTSRHLALQGRCRRSWSAGYNYPPGF